MAKADLGTKRTCPSCGAKFYDLGRQPARCPKCEHEFDPETDDVRAPARSAPEPKEEPKPAEPADQDGFGEEADDTPELDAAAAEKMPEDSDDDDESDGSGLSDDLPDGFNEGDVEDNDEEDDTSLLIDDEEDDDFSDLAANKDEDL